MKSVKPGSKSNQLQPSYLLLLPSPENTFDQWSLTFPKEKDQIIETAMEK